MGRDRYSSRPACLSRGQTRRLRDVSSMSACDLIAAMADRGGRFQLTRKSKTPRASAPGAIPILEFRNSYPRRRIPSTQKRQRPYFSGRHQLCAGIGVTLRIPFDPSSQSRIPNTRTSALSARRRLPIQTPATTSCPRRRTAAVDVHSRDRRLSPANYSASRET
jgi:hypothetical protein